MQKTKMDKLMERFRESLIRGYECILPKESLENGNLWFEQFLQSSIEEVLRDVVGEEKRLRGAGNKIDTLELIHLGYNKCHEGFIKKARDEWGININE